jgi:starvation-inducible outer membrane lipoprotein
MKNNLYNLICDTISVCLILLIIFALCSLSGCASMPQGLKDLTEILASAPYTTTNFKK